MPATQDMALISLLGQIGLVKLQVKTVVERSLSKRRRCGSGAAPAGAQPGSVRCHLQSGLKYARIFSVSFIFSDAPDVLVNGGFARFLTCRVKGYLIERPSQMANFAEVADSTSYRSY